MQTKGNLQFKIENEGQTNVFERNNIECGAMARTGIKDGDEDIKDQSSFVIGIVIGSVCFGKASMRITEVL